jgi:two-component system sensor histidine kinase/response regulator
VIMVDGNVLRRETFLTAVAAAAGRVALEPGRGAEKQDPAERVVLSRDEALRKGCLILVVEDNETNQKVILAQLRACGLTADVVGNGREALERWEGAAYGLLLTDLHMPQMDGYELTTAIRTRESGAQHVPIVALTANALQGEAERCREVGMDDYLSKPVALEDLKAMLDKWLPSASLSARLNETTVHATALPADINVLKALIGGDETSMRKLLLDFMASTDRVAAEMRAACATGQPAAARAAAHKLKSSARAIGALTLSELCVGMERAGGAGDMEMLATTLPLFEHEISLVNSYLRSILDGDGWQ